VLDLGHEPWTAAAVLSRKRSDQAKVVNKCGYLLKKAGCWMSAASWQRRWLVLGAFRLEYFKGWEEGLKPLGSIDLASVEAARRSRASLASQRLPEMELVTFARTYRFRAASDGEIEAWIQAIRDTLRASTDVLSSGVTARADCPLCFERLAAATRAYAACGHRYCRSCLALETTTLCVICDKPMCVLPLTRALIDCHRILSYS
jgi:hypothetical protein